MAKAFGLFKTTDVNCWNKEDLRLLLHSDKANNKMVRKRAASEMDLQTGGAGEFHRLLRRTFTTGPPASNIPPPAPPAPVGAHDFVVCSNNPNLPNPNYSTTTVPALPSSTNLSVTSAGSASDSAFSSLSHHQINRQGLIQSQTPSVCVFSGLPLFPPDRNHPSSVAAGSLLAPPFTPLSNPNSTSVVNGVISMDQDSSATTAWIDNFIKDLIHSSTHVSIPQLIQNVREIIYPCNPNLASIVEYRLRSLSGTDYTSGGRTRKALAQQDHESHPQLVQVGTSESPNQYVNWGFTLPKATTTNAAEISRSDPVSGSGFSFVTSAAAPLPACSPSQVQHPNHNQPEEAPEQPRKESPPPPPSSTAVAPAVVTEKKDEIMKKKRDEDGLHLLTLLLQCAEAVASDNLEEANNMLLEISQLSTPFGTSAQRVAAYFSEAMSARLVSSCLGIYASLPTVPHSQKMASAFQVFNGISPFVKFSHFTANQAIQEAFEREERVHIIDLDIMQGLQWPGLFHILASRPGGPPFVRLTGLGTSIEALEATGKRLTDFADKLGLPFEFNPVADKVGNLDPDKLKVSKREAVAVHWLQHCLYDVTGSDTNTLWLLQRY